MGWYARRFVRDDLAMKALRTFSMRGLLFKKGEDVIGIPEKNVPLLIAEGWIAEDKVEPVKVEPETIKPKLAKEKKK